MYKYICLFIFLIFSISYLYNLENQYFRDYIIETTNYFLLFLPLTHTYIYENNIIVGFYSKLFGIAIIAIYIKPQYRLQNISKNFFENLNSEYIFTNNSIIKKIIKDKSINIIDIPLFHLFYIK
jgi:hypothetical protein